LVVLLGQAVAAGSLSDADAAAARRVTQEYVDAWLANDPARVMATLTPDAVILPSGLAAIAGERNIRSFWWPSNGPRTTVTAMQLDVDEVIGDGAVAIVRGRGLLRYRTDADARETTVTSWFINVVARQADGRWLIARRAWSDRRP
jgi:uncharacterized protein (TIGR02246 family)